MSKTPKYDALPTWAKNLYSQTKARAKKRQFAFDLTKDGYAALVTDSCALTGIPFETGRPREAGRHFKRPYAPSIDRIDSNAGYTDSNVRLVCVAVNLAMNTWGEEVLFKIAYGLFRSDKSTTKWRRAEEMLPEGVKLEAMSRNGPRYSARFRHLDKRIYIGCFSTIEAAARAIEEAKSLVLKYGYYPPITLEKYARRARKQKPVVNQ